MSEYRNGLYVRVRFCETTSESLVTPGFSHGSLRLQDAGRHRGGWRRSYPIVSESQSPPRQIAGVTDFFADINVPAVFRKSIVSVDSSQQVMSATVEMFGGALFVHSLSLPDNPVPIYLALFQTVLL